MKDDACRRWRENLGALLLGQLEDSERAATEAHLDGCADCRAELDLLEPVARALPLADPARLAAPPAPPRSLAHRIARGIAAEKRARRRRRLRIGIATAAAAACGGVLAALLLGGGSSPAPPPVERQVAFTSVPRGVQLDATLEPRPWGSEITLRVRGITPGTRCEVWLRRGDGTRVPAGSFRYRYEGGSDAAALSSALRPSQARAIGIRAGERTFIAPIA
jgi:anti-sigma factor RsiW